MKTNLRFAAASATVLGAVWATAAFADWPFSAALRLSPAFSGECEDCDLSGRLLNDTRFVGGVFRRANFSNAVMTRVDASGSVFEDANFTMADLSYAKLIDAECGGADFEQAILVHSDASGGDFSGADFRGANLQNGIFREANLSAASFNRARLGGADFRGADLRRATGLTNRQLVDACGDEETRLPRGLVIPRC